MKIDLKKLSGKVNTPSKLHHGNKSDESNDIFLEPGKDAEKQIKEIASAQNNALKLIDRRKNAGLFNSQKIVPEKLTSKKTFSRDKSRRSHYITKK